MLSELKGWKPSIRNLFEGTAFAAASINFGPQTVSIPHLDFGNLAWGLCAVTALGNYNPDLGGHIVLEELKLVIRFPPGCTIFLPSALVTHANTPISDQETRYSLAQYSSAGLFRWVHNGFVTEKKMKSKLNKAQRQDLDAKEVDERSVRFLRGLERLSKLSDFKLPIHQV